MVAYLIIFGAAVRADGTPSGTLARRVEGAANEALAAADIRFMPTGGRGATGYIEAEVMRDALVAVGVDPELITLEDQGRDTLESVMLCDQLLREAGDVTLVEPCTSSYHQPRCALLFSLLGWRVRIPYMPSDYGEVPLRKLIWFALRELAALPYDVLLLAARMRARRKSIERSTK